MRRSATRFAVSFGVATFLAAGAAIAEPSGEDRALATAMFNEGKTLLAENRVAEACRKLEESQRLDPLPGTLLNLAVCHEREGRLATAFAELREARVLAERDHRDDRVAFATTHMDDIEPRIAKLVIRVAPNARVTHLAIARNGTPLGHAAWGTPIPVDPGEHVIMVIAPDKKPSAIVVAVTTEGEVLTIDVDPLDDEDILPVARPPRGPDAPPSPTGLSTRRKVAVGVAGGGLVAAGIASVFGVRALVKANDPDAVCATTPCSATSTKLHDQARSAADVSTIGFVVAGVLLGAGAFLWFGDSPPPTSARVTPRGLAVQF